MLTEDFYSLLKTGITLNEVKPIQVKDPTTIVQFVLEASGGGWPGRSLLDTRFSSGTHKGLQCCQILLVVPDLERPL